MLKKILVTGLLSHTDANQFCGRLKKSKAITDSHEIWYAGHYLTSEEVLRLTKEKDPIVVIYPSMKWSDIAVHVKLIEENLSPGKEIKHFAFKPSGLTSREMKIFAKKVSYFFTIKNLADSINQLPEFETIIGSRGESLVVPMEESLPAAASA